MIAEFRMHFSQQIKIRWRILGCSGFGVRQYSALNKIKETFFAKNFPESDVSPAD